MDKWGTKMAMGCIWDLDNKFNPFMTSNKVFWMIKEAEFQVSKNLGMLLFSKVNLKISMGLKT